MQSFQEFPDLIEYLMQQEKEVGKGDISEADYLVKLIKSKQLKQALSVTEDIGEMVKFALPLMLEKAEDKTNYHKIIDYIDENGIKDEFNSAVFGFISLGFTLGEQGQEAKSQVRNEVEETTKPSKADYIFRKGIKQYFEEDWLDYALQIGMTPDQFWYDNPQLFYNYEQKVYRRNKAKRN